MLSSAPPNRPSSGTRTSSPCASGKDIEQQVAELDTSLGRDFLFDLLRAYGLPKASISRLRSGAYDKSSRDDEHLWRGKVYYRSVDSDDEELYTAIDAASSEGWILDIEIEELQNHAAFFLPWAGIEKTQIENLNLADVKAAEKMAKLYDEIPKYAVQSR